MAETYGSKKTGKTPYIEEGLTHHEFRPGMPGMRSINGHQHRSGEGMQSIPIEHYPHPAFAEIVDSGPESVLWRTPLEKPWMYRGMGTKALRKLACDGAKTEYTIYGSGKVTGILLDSFIKAQSPRPSHKNIETMHRYAGLEKFLESQLPPMQASEMMGLGTDEYQQRLDAYLQGIQDAGIDAIFETMLPQPKNPERISL